MTEFGTWDIGILLRLIGEGELHAELCEELQELASELGKRAKIERKITHGTMTIKLDLAATEEGIITIDPAVSTKLPNKRRKASTFWIGKNGITQDNPKQQRLPLREVNTNRSIVEPATRAESEYAS